MIHLRREVKPTCVAEGLPLAYAQGLGEDIARQLGMERLSDAEAPWRAQPASEKQKALLHKLDIAVVPGLTKAEAADQISAVLGDWN